MAVKATKPSVNRPQATARTGGGSSTMIGSASDVGAPYRQPNKYKPASPGQRNAIIAAGLMAIPGGAVISAARAGVLAARIGKTISDGASKPTPGRGTGTRPSGGTARAKPTSTTNRTARRAGETVDQHLSRLDSYLPAAATLASRRAAQNEKLYGPNWKSILDEATARVKANGGGRPTSGTGTRPSGGTAKARPSEKPRADRPPGGRVQKEPVDIVGRVTPRGGRTAIGSGSSVARSTQRATNNQGAQRALGPGRASATARPSGSTRPSGRVAKAPIAIPVAAGALAAAGPRGDKNKGTPMRPVPTGNKGTPMRPVPGRGTPMRPVPSASKPDKPKPDKPAKPSPSGGGKPGGGKPSTPAKPKGRIVSQSDTKFVPGIGVVLKSAPNKKYTGRIKMVVEGTTRAKNGIADYSKGRNKRGYGKEQLQPVNKGSLNGPYAKPKARSKAPSKKSVPMKKGK